MEWVLLAAIIGAWFAVKRGIPAAGRALQGQYRKRKEVAAAKHSLAREAVGDGHAKYAATLGHKAGAALAVTLTGWGVAWRAAAQAAKTGYREGKERTAAWRAKVPYRPTQSRPEPDSSEMHDVDDDNRNYMGRLTEKVNKCAELGLCGWVEELYLLEGEPCGKPVADGHPYCFEHVYVARREYDRTYRDHYDQPTPELAEEPEPTRQPTLTVVPTAKEGATPVAIATVTNGEVLTEEQLKAEMQARIAEATAELDDAQGDLRRAEEEIACTENISVSLNEAKIDPDIVKAVGGFADTNSDRTRLAKERVAAAEQRKSAAEGVLTALNASRQKTFYNG